MKTDELRRRFLAFFEQRDHRIFPSDSLVPEGDASVLFTGAGMNQFKDAFLGKGPKDLTRACSSQKCLRMPDLDNVGRTPSHHTLFEMLGNFSFGDYFKSEAIAWAFEFLTKELAIPKERLAISVYLDDDEAAGIWQNDIGIAKDRIFRYGEEDNFWPAEAPSKGPNGPCGPCSEIYFDFGEHRSTARGGVSDPASDNGRFVEVWNLVFTQYDRRGVNELVPLPRKNIDTGMGLERIARVMQDKPTNFDTDLFQPILGRIEDLSGKKYGKDPLDDSRMRRIADHIRAATFCISDGVRPGNEGRGYIVRKVIRRAGMDLRELGRDKPGLLDVVPAIAEAMRPAYPELTERLSTIRDAVGLEEERFGEVYQQGTEKLRVYLDELDRAGSKALSAKKAFFLWDTVGFPFDITRRYCEDHGYTVDEAEYETLMDEQRRRARDASQISGDIFGTGPASKLKGEIAPTRFVGYDALEGAARVVAILAEGGERVSSVSAGTTASVVLDATPFYGESGGQVGDSGVLEGSAGASLAEVLETRKAEDYHLHLVRPRAAISVGDEVFARVDRGRRGDIMRNHTATHLLHWALRRVMGDETTQAGSLVHPDYLRFDYTARSAPTPAAIQEVEDLVNGQILKDLAVGKTERSFDEARASGAMALFGEKYGDRVRVVSVLDEASVVGAGRDHDSVELCGGTHCDRTGQIGQIKITSDSAVAAGVRRITAVTGFGALRAVQMKFRLAQELAALLKSREDEMPERVSALIAERQRLEKELLRARQADALSAVGVVMAEARDVGGVPLIIHTLDGIEPDDLRALSDKVVEGAPECVAVLVGRLGDHAAIVVRCGAVAIGKGLKAGNLCRELAKALGGGGGGRPDMAQGQARSVEGLAEALDGVRSTIESALSGG